MNERFIVCAALRNEAGEIICAPRHFDALMHNAIKARSDSETWKRAEQGFVDQFGEFLNRSDARQIAFLERQIRRRVGGDTIALYSENLY